MQDTKLNQIKISYENILKTEQHVNMNELHLVSGNTLYVNSL